MWLGLGLVRLAIAYEYYNSYQESYNLNDNAWKFTESTAVAPTQKTEEWQKHVNSQGITNWEEHLRSQGIDPAVRKSSSLFAQAEAAAPNPYTPNPLKRHFHTRFSYYVSLKRDPIIHQNISENPPYRKSP